jgi:hypothetical protein
MCTYTPEQKAAVIADLLSGCTINQCVEKYDIPRGTIGYWSASLKQESNNPNIKKEKTGELIVANLTIGLEKYREILEAIDASWIRAQSAHDVAVLLGVISDKSHRILDGIARRQDADRAEAESEMDTEAED